MIHIKNLLEGKRELLGWYEIYLRLFRLLKKNEEKIKLNEMWQRMKSGINKLYEI